MCRPPIFRPSIRSRSVLLLVLLTSEPVEHTEEERECEESSDPFVFHVVLPSCNWIEVGVFLKGPYKRLSSSGHAPDRVCQAVLGRLRNTNAFREFGRSEENTSELQTLMRT